MKIFTKFIIISVIFSIILISGCVSNDQKISENSTTNTSSNVEKVEIIHFHWTNQCNSCIAVGALAEKTVNTYFSDELESGKITFAHINAELPINKDLVSKYGVNSASLWIGVYDENGFHKEMNANVWYKINNETDYMSYLKGVIEKRLVGDFS